MDLLTIQGHAAFDASWLLCQLQTQGANHRCTHGVYIHGSLLHYHARAEKQRRGSFTTLLCVVNY